LWSRTMDSVAAAGRNASCSKIAVQHSS
jgi:hypothetical protein